MSDPVSDAEIEDVLASIRRLIQSGDEPQQQEDASDENKLILSAAFRVHDEAQDETAESPDEAPSETAKQTEASVGESEEDVLALADPMEQGEGDAQEAPFADLEGLQEALTGDLEALDTARSDDDEPKDAEVEPPTEAAELDETSERLGDRAVEMEMAVSEAADIWEPDGGEDAAQVEVLRFHASRSVPQSDPEPAGVDADVEAETEEVVGTDAVAEVELEEASPSSDVEEIQKTAEETAPEPTEDAEASSDGQLDEDGQSEEQNTDDQDETVPSTPLAQMDEAELRELIAEIVREEIKRAGMWRVNRRIRRAIRAEIGNALSRIEDDDDDEE